MLACLRACVPDISRPLRPSFPLSPPLCRRSGSRTRAVTSPSCASKARPPPRRPSCTAGAHTRCPQRTRAFLTSCPGFRPSCIDQRERGHPRPRVDRAGGDVLRPHAAAGNVRHRQQHPHGRRSLRAGLCAVREPGRLHLFADRRPSVAQEPAARQRERRPVRRGRPESQLCQPVRFTARPFWRGVRAHLVCSRRRLCCAPPTPLSWGGVGASANPCATDFRGPAAASEPETQAVQAFVQSLSNRAAGVDVHAYGQFILRSRGYTAAPAANEAELKAIGDGVSSAIRAVHGAVYTSERAAELYPTTGSTDDWYTEQVGVYRARRSGRSGPKLTAGGWLWWRAGGDAGLDHRAT